MGIEIAKYRKEVNSKVDKKSTSSLLDKEIPIGQWKLTDKKKERFYREMHLLITAGLDIQSALQMIREESLKKKDQTFYTKIEAAVTGGKSLSHAAEESNQFSPYEFQSMRIGEESGRMEETFYELSAYYSSRIALKRQLLKVLAYPFFIIVVSVVVIWFMLSFVVPLFEGVFLRFGAELPSITQFVIDTADVFSRYVPYVAILILLFILILRSQRKKEWFRKIQATIMIRLPIFGDLFKKIYMTRFSQSMYLLTSAHTPLVNALEMTKDMVNFYPLEKAIEKTREDVIQGLSLNKALGKHKIFDRKMVSLIRVSEEVNKLGDMFGSLSDQYNKEIEHKSSIIGSLLEPIMILIIALFVGFILVSMYLPLFELSKIMR